MVGPSIQKSADMTQTRRRLFWRNECVDESQERKAERFNLCMFGQINQMLVNVIGGEPCYNALHE